MNSNLPILLYLISGLRGGSVSETTVINRLTSMNYHFTIACSGNKEKPFKVYSNYLKSSDCKSLVSALIEFMQEYVKIEAPSGDGFIQI